MIYCRQKQAKKKKTETHGGWVTIYCRQKQRRKRLKHRVGGCDLLQTKPNKQRRKRLKHNGMIYCRQKQTKKKTKQKTVLSRRMKDKLNLN